jgi:hypothetical protein
VGIQVLTVARVEMTAFWDAAPCSLWKLTDVSGKHFSSIIKARLQGYTT